MFKDGDKAIVRMDLTNKEKGTWPEFVSEMEAYVGREVTVVRRYPGDKTFSIVEDGGRFSWIDSWLIPVEKFDATSGEELIDFLGMRIY